jgi:NTP pyrophosphatase (non-canonical NTP hydrolase)
MPTIRETQKRAWDIVESKGFHAMDLDDYADNWEDHQRILARLMMITEEVGEACHAVRKDDFANFAEELADIVIRVMDTAETYGVNLEQRIIDKLDKNEKREHMHGKRC